MKNIKLSIVIPTRNGHETIKYAILTCLKQKMTNYEIIVCDNFSTIPIKKILEEINSEKIQYYRTSKPLAMSDNWEYALSKSSGTYVTILGDDDGFLPYAFKIIEYYMRNFKYKALRWNQMGYYWPNFYDKTKSNELSINMYALDTISKSEKIISSVANYKVPYQMLPMIYNSVIHRDLLDTLKDQNKKIFSSMIPDIFSGFAFGYLAKRYLSIGRPISIGGTSKKSNGYSVLMLKKRNEISEDFTKLNIIGGYKWHSKIPEIMTLPTVIAESFQQVKDILFKDSNRIKLDRKKLIQNCLSDMQIVNIIQWKNVYNSIIKSITDNTLLTEWFVNHYSPNSYINMNTKRISLNKIIKTIFPFYRMFDNIGIPLKFNMQSYNITNIYQIGNFYKENILFNEKKNPLKFKLQYISKYYQNILMKILKKKRETDNFNAL